MKITVKTPRFIWPSALIFFVYAVYFIFFQIEEKEGLNPVDENSNFKITKSVITSIKSRDIGNLPKWELGKSLVRETSFFNGQDKSCLECHRSDQKDQAYNKTPLWNMGLYSYHMSDGRYRSLGEIFIDGNHFKKVLKNDQVELQIIEGTVYAQLFSEVYQDGLNIKNVRDAVIYYLKNLNSKRTRLDKYLDGDLIQLTRDEVKGERLFINKGCVNCHHGVLLGGNSLQFINPYRKVETKQIVRVPALRNVLASKKIAGNEKKLREVISEMGQDYSGTILSSEEVEKIFLFIKAATPIEEVSDE